MTRHGNDSRVLLVVTDGLGYAPDRVREMAERVRDQLKPASRLAVQRAVAEACPSDEIDRQLIELMAVAPRWIELVAPDADTKSVMRIGDIVNRCHQTKNFVGLSDELQSAWSTVGETYRYIPWSAEVPQWSRVVNRNLTFPTFASGIWVGYEDVDPPVQGNSETGHQQIGNFTLAPQIPLTISQSVHDGSFYENAAIRDVISQTVTHAGNVNICFLLSGMTGSDGRVHSAWEHLEAMLELVFVRLNLPTSTVRLQAILDGRDAPATGSLRLDGARGGYLGELSRLLARYDAEESLAWVIGRSIAMDRDYREDCAEANYLLLTGGRGTPARDIDDVRSLVAEVHDRGGTDADTPPIAVHADGHEPPTVSCGDAFINLNFRSDRQRAVTASLSNARDYLQRESSLRGRPWNMNWLRDDLRLNLCAIAEYDAEFTKHHGVQVAFPTEPHALNFINAWEQIVGGGSTYFLAAESVKASHMGFFIRGRRESPKCVDSEVRWITPSAAASEGVFSDSDFYKVPAMKTGEVVERVSEAMTKETHRLMMCNLAAPDMIGHLLPRRWEAAISAYRVTCEALLKLRHVAANTGVHMIVTSDHGNIEEDAPTHTANPVLTTVIPSNSEHRPRPARTNIGARLYDIPHCIAHLLDVDPAVVRRFVDSAAATAVDKRFRGSSLIR